MGHALQHSIHDLIIRRKRMQGFNALCLPGTDHAGIATQMKVEQALQKEGISRWDLGREGFLNKAREWTLKYGGTILKQLQALGCSYDWSRTRFTLDEFVSEGPGTSGWAQSRLYETPGYARAVLAAFVHFYNRGWIYRGERIVNWCPQCRTVVSDLEVEHREVDSSLWFFRYPSENGGDGVVVATTRPETMLGDTGVAVSPSDDRYRHLVGAQLTLPLQNRSIPVVADHHVDLTFGSGAVKVTPAHDPNDWEIAQRHPDLMPPISVIDDGGIMTANAGLYAGLPREAASVQVIDALEKLGLLVKTEEYRHAVGHHDKCGTIIEPLLKLQWFARCRELADQALQSIRTGHVTYVPERFAQMEIEWLENIRDWCVSRQLWWGHRIPLHYCTRCDADQLILNSDQKERTILTVLDGANPIPSIETPENCPRCNGTDLLQDPDVLDTWFSSALWPHATLGWPERTVELEYFYPTDLMITGRDILYLWVARMIMTGQEFMRAEPFREVLVHATVMTEDGQRMSKSLGTGVDPLELIALYGADATRFGLTALVTGSQDIRFKMLWNSGGKKQAGPEDRLRRAEQIEQMRYFCNKLWNIAKFTLFNLSGVEIKVTPIEETRIACNSDSLQLDLADRWILSRFAAASAAVNDALDRYALGEASWTLYHFVWDELADWYVELVKPRLRSDKPEIARQVLLSVLEGTLRLAHPFLPFISEEIWQVLPGKAEYGTLMMEPYPGALPELVDAAAEAEMATVIEMTRAIRDLKREVGIPDKPATISVIGKGPYQKEYVEQRARVTITENGQQGLTAHTSVAGMEIALFVEGLLDVVAEKARIRKELDGVERDLAGVADRLANEQFISRAPVDIVEKQRRNYADLMEKKERLQSRLQLFGV